MVLKVFVATHLMARYAFAVCVQVVWNQGVTVYAGGCMFTFGAVTFKVRLWFPRHNTLGRKRRLV
jgi:hypothetical protein